MSGVDEQRLNYDVFVDLCPSCDKLKRVYFAMVGRYQSETVGALSWIKRFGLSTQLWDRRTTYNSVLKYKVFCAFCGYVFAGLNRKKLIDVFRLDRFGIP